jgi:hypothetical protein
VQNVLQPEGESDNPMIALVHTSVDEVDVCVLSYYSR